MTKYVYNFGGGKAEGNAKMKNLLGGKGANLAEMSGLGIPVPPGFTITTEVCAELSETGNYPDSLKEQVVDSIAKAEKIMGTKFGDVENPLLFSVRSGARISMPGMMETVLNIGLTSETIPGLIAKTGDERFVYDAYRRLQMMYSDVVMEKAAGRKLAQGKGIRLLLEAKMDEMKEDRNVKNDTDLTASDLKELSKRFNEIIEREMSESFPDDAMEQLWGSINAVFVSWNGKRAIEYRKAEGIQNKWGTATNVQTMVFGNMGENSATGVAFTRDPATGENSFFGEWLINAQGEDVVAGIRTPRILSGAENSMDKVMPTQYQQLVEIRDLLENHYRDMQDVEFTIQDGKLWMLQTRTGKRNGVAAVRMAVEMENEKMISQEKAILRVKPEQIDELLHPIFDKKNEKLYVAIAKGLPAGPGGAYGQIAFSAEDAETMAKDGKKVILVRDETSPEDVAGMNAAEGILTARGGMTSHAALVARGWGKCCIVGCGELQIDDDAKTLKIDEKVFGEGDFLTLNGTKGNVYNGKLPLITPDIEKNEHLKMLMKWVDKTRSLKVRTNAESPKDADRAISFGAEGIGLCRTEHMFFEPERIIWVRRMIVAKTEEERRDAVMHLLPFQKEDFKGILNAMAGKPVTIRLLDPPLHEFITLDDEQITELASELGIRADELKIKIDALHESNPMLGHRGCRLGIAYPEITEMQARAIFEAAIELQNEGIQAMPEVMIPLVGDVCELENQRKIVEKTANEVFEKTGKSIAVSIGTMIELPRACLTADEIGKVADFFSFGTNDLTQTTFGISRDDAGKFLPFYIEKGILKDDPFAVLDQNGVGKLVEMGVKLGRSTKPNLKVGICGEHGGEPSSVEFCHRAGLDYVSCSPFRVPIARFAAAQAQIKNPR